MVAAAGAPPALVVAAVVAAVIPGRQKQDFNVGNKITLPDQLNQSTRF